MQKIGFVRLLLIGAGIKILGLLFLFFIGDNPESIFAYLSPIFIITGIILFSMGLYTHAKQNRTTSN